MWLLMIYEPVTISEATGNTEHVYGCQCTGDNLFYANGIMAEGVWSRGEAIADALEEAPVKKTTKNPARKDESVEAAECLEKVEE